MRDRQLGRNVSRQRVGAVIRNTRNVGKRHADVAGVRIDNLRIVDVEIGRLRLQDGARNLKNIALQFLRGLECGLAADACATAGPIGPALGRHVSVAGDDAHRLAIDAEIFRSDLADDGFSPLTVLAHTDETLHPRPMA